MGRDLGENLSEGLRGQTAQSLLDLFASRSLHNFLLNRGRGMATEAGQLMMRDILRFPLLLGFEEIVRRPKIFAY